MLVTKNLFFSMTKLYTANDSAFISNKDGFMLKLSFDNYLLPPIWRLYGASDSTSGTLYGTI